LLPALLPADYFRETGRWDVFGDNLLRLKDRKGGDYHLGPTHEEIITDLVRREVRSYRDLPRNLYQIQTKYRDEPRPRGGLLRCREFIMKDAYSFDVDEPRALASYEVMRRAYVNIFDRLGLEYRMVQADSGSMGGSTSAEFQVLAQSGEDSICACNACDYAANAEVASARRPEATCDPGTPSYRKVHTPGARTISEVAAFLQKCPEKFLKSLIYQAGGEVVMAVLRGDHEVNEIKLARVLGVSEVALADDVQIAKATGAGVGFAGPVGFRGRVVIDHDAAVVRGGVTGANEDDYHLVDVEFGRDFEATVADFRAVVERDMCPKCDGGRLRLFRSIEGGHIFVLGTHYSAKMKANFLDETGKEKPVVMGCYGIGVSRLIATAVEQHHDDDGILWPMSIAPYQVHVVNIGPDEATRAAAEKLSGELAALGVEVLWDDRAERPGVKFMDADLVGIPLRVTVGKKGLSQGYVELKPRVEKDNKKAEMLPVDTAAVAVFERVRAMLNK
ncbi:MAG: proline--tRNA ligase, partial [Polyangiaceae bacterium]|nr:proline--tRNA ligase [Polyangiaceae bacterium]